MDQKSSLPSFTETDIKKVLGTPEGQALLKLLQKDGGNALRQAARALQNGDTKTAQDLVRPIMESQDAAKLIDKINRK